MWQITYSLVTDLTDSPFFETSSDAVFVVNISKHTSIILSFPLSRYAVKVQVYAKLINYSYFGEGGVRTLL